MIFSPSKYGADVVIHSLTNLLMVLPIPLVELFVLDEEFIGSMIDVNSGSAMLLRSCNGFYASSKYP